MQQVFLVPPDPRWADEFTRESAAVARAFGKALTAIHHIGSTAVPGIWAKPVIDMLAVVSEIGEADRRTSAMEALGYEALGEFGLPGRRYFRKNDALGNRTHQVHTFARGSFEIRRHLAFRDFLRSNPESARIYESLKRRLAAAYPEDIGKYTDGKDAFIAEIDAKAALPQSSSPPTNSPSED